MNQVACPFAAQQNNLLARYMLTYLCPPSDPRASAILPTENVGRYFEEVRAAHQ